MLQWHRVGSIFAHTKAHADPEEVGVLPARLQEHNKEKIIDRIIFFSFYPLYPPVEDINLDYEKFQCFAQMPLTPDVLILPSELRYFVKVKKMFPLRILHCTFHCVQCTLKTLVVGLPQDVIGCVCVNPGRLTKGQVGGTFGRLLIRRSAQSEDEKRTSPCLAAQVVRI